MRCRAILVALLVALIGAEALDAQGLRLPFRRRPQTAIIPASVALTTPTTLPTFETTDTAVSPCVTTGGTYAIASVTWSNAATSGSGNAANTGPNTWCVTQSSTLTVAQDTIATGSDIAITSLTPSPIGSAWTCPVDTTAGANPILATTTGTIAPTSSDASGSARIICLITPATAIVGTNYDVSIVLGTQSSNTSDSLAIIFGYAGTADYCSLNIFPAAASTDMSFSTTVAGSSLVIGTPANANPLAGHTVKVEVRGTSLTAKLQGTTVISTTSTACDNAAGVGVGWGSFRGQTGTTTHVYDTFTEASDTLLTAHTSDIGGAKTEEIDTCGVTAQVIGSSDRVRVDDNTAPANCGALYSFTPAPALSSADYTVQLTVGGTTGSVIPVCFGGRYVDSSNYVALCWYGTGANPDVKLIEMSGGVLTTLDTADCAPTTGHIYFITFSGSTVSAGRQATACLLDGTTSVSSTGKPFIGWGSISGNAGDDTSLSMSADNFTVTSGGGGDTISLLSAVDSLTVVDQDATTPGIPVNAGSNAITFTATPVTGSAATAVWTVTRNVSDTTPPLISITAPVGVPTFSTTGTALNLGGTASDNSGSVTVTWECTTGTCTPDSGTATWSAGTWTANNIGLPSGSSVITVTATDGATLTATDTLSVTSSPTDITDPTISILTPNGGSNFSTGTALTTFTGSASDNTGIAVNGITWSCPTCSPSAGVATGTTGWSFSTSLASGTNTVTVTARDDALNDATDSIVGTLSIPLNISTLSMASSVEDVTYPNGGSGVTLVAVGGTPPYAWVENGTGTSSMGGGSCTGLALSAAGVVSGTPTTPGTCSFTAKVTDNSGGACPGSACDTQALSITVTATGAETSHDYYNSLVADPAKWINRSFRNTTDVAQTCQGSCDPVTGSTVYIYSTDTDQQKQDGVKVQVKQFTPSRSLAADVSGAAAAGTLGRLVVTGALTLPSNWGPSNSVRVDNEVLYIPDLSVFTRTITTSTPNGASTTLTFTTPHVFLDGDSVTINSNHVGEDPSFGSTVFVVTVLNATQISIPFALTTGGTGGLAIFKMQATAVPVQRGSYGTAVAAHTAGTLGYISTNSLADQLKQNAQTADGFSYLYTWDEYLTNSYYNANLGNFKWVNIYKKTTSSTAPGIETRLDWSPNGPISPGCPSGTFTQGVHIGQWANIRYYGTAQGGATDVDPWEPRTTNILCVQPGRWVRHWLYYERIAGDIDRIWMWVGDEQNNPVAVYENMGSTIDLTAWVLEMNTSENTVSRPVYFQDLVSYFRNMVILRWTLGTEGGASGVAASYITGRKPIP